MAAEAKATIRYPALAMDEYASMRFTFVCMMAHRMPMVMARMETTQITQNQLGEAVSLTKRISTAKAAAVGALAMARKAGTVVSGFGNYPVLIEIAHHPVACDLAEKRFLITYGDAAGFSFACMRPGYVRP